MQIDKRNNSIAFSQKDQIFPFVKEFMERRDELESLTFSVSNLKNLLVFLCQKIKKHNIGMGINIAELLYFYMEINSINVQRYERTLTELQGVPNKNRCREITLPAANELKDPEELFIAICSEIISVGLSKEVIQEIEQILDKGDRLLQLVDGAPLKASDLRYHNSTRNHCNFFKCCSDADSSETETLLDEKIETSDSSCGCSIC